VSGPRAFPRELHAPPRLVIELGLEGRPRLHVVAETAEDEARLLGWLASAHAREWLLRAAREQLDTFGPPEEAA
jgi:hypothetical protein